jgi:VIT1/CCC1 family predicted Fe2+/Mn2+ transporter
MSALEIIGLIASLAIVGVSLAWILASTARPQGKVVQKRKHKIVEWEDKP